MRTCRGVPPRAPLLTPEERAAIKGRPRRDAPTCLHHLIASMEDLIDDRIQ